MRPTGPERSPVAPDTAHRVDCERMALDLPFSRRAAATCLMLSVACSTACSSPSDQPVGSGTSDLARVAAEVEAAVWAFHAADTARDAEAVIRLLWPEYTMLVDGARRTYDEVASGSRGFMANLATFDTQWHDLQVTPLGRDAAIASFRFRDSIVTRAGEVTRSEGTTTFAWQRRGEEWRVLFADADHRPIAP